MRFNLANRYKHFKRYREISQVLLKHGFGFLLEVLDLKKYLPFKKRLKKHDSDFNKENLAKRTRLVLEELGPTFIKLGQILSTRADIIAPEFITEFSKLQDEVEGISFAKIKKVLNEELSEDYKKTFEYVNEEYQAAASIAQIHKAKLKNGQNVILKIQKPGIERKIKADIEILQNLANVLKNRNIIPDYIEPNNIISQFEEEIKKEIDFKKEISNIKKFQNNFKDNSHIIIPEVYDKISSKKLLVMEEVKGTKLSEVDPDHQDIDAEYIAELGAWALFKQILIDGFFHGDPHPGNIFVVDKDKIAYLDFGLAGHITQKDKDAFTTIFLAVLGKKTEIIVDKIMDIGIVDQDIDRRKLILEFEDLLNRYYSKELSEIDLSSINKDLQRLIYKFHIKLPSEFFLLMRAMAVSEGVGTSLDPNFNIFNMKERFIKDLVEDRLKPKNLASRIFNIFWKFRKTGKRVPKEMEELLTKIVDDDLSIKFEHTNLEPLIKKLDIVSNRLSVSLIVSALLIGSSMILQTDIAPHIFGIPLLGFLGYTSAGVLGLWLVITIFRSGKF